LVTLKKFNVVIYPPKPVCVKEVIWPPPSPGWIKCNTDGAANSTTSAAGGIFRDSLANFLSCFTENMGGGSAFHSELSVILRETEIAFQRGWKNMWIETDSSLAVMAFKNDSAIPCDPRNRWKNCKCLLYCMNFMITHVYRDGNKCADKLASIGLDLHGFTVWLCMPNFLSSLLLHDKQGMPNFRVSHV
jgi:hypothetical protein